jgi:methionyl-tRNA formyltransferase
LQISVASSSLLAIPVIEAVLASDHTLASLITTPDKKSGRGQTLAQTAIADWADAHAIVVAKPDSTATLNQHLLSAQPQLIITLSYGRMIPVELLHGPRFGWLNVHFSLLPRWRGAAPVQWALLEGDQQTGISIFKLDKGMDTGPIYFQEEVAITSEATTEDLLDSLSQLAGQRILEVVTAITKATKPTPQPTAGVSLAPKISKEMSEFDWFDSADALLRKSRALGVRPGTWSNFRGERIAIGAISESLAVNELSQIGEIAGTDGKLLVRCSDSVLEIHELTPAGKKKMSGADFLRGARLEPGEKFTSSKASV